MMRKFSSAVSLDNGRPIDPDASEFLRHVLAEVLQAIEPLGGVGDPHDGLAWLVIKGVDRYPG